MSSTQTTYFDHDELAEAMDAAYATAVEAAPSGKVARYIPQLANANPNHVGLVFCGLDGTVVTRGDVRESFTLQSVSKIFALAAVACDRGHACFEDISVEPSGDSFHSIVLLEDEHGRPRNPVINAGAILISERLPGASSGTKIAGLREWLNALEPNSPKQFAVDDATAQSELETGFRNRALANYMRHFGVLDDPDLACATYFRQCAIQADAVSLAKLGGFLANGGINPDTGERVLPAAINRAILAIMTTCGLYDEVGQFAVNVGLPAKSGVSGALLAIVPGVGSIAAYGPALGRKGNSVAGMAALASLSDRLKLSLFD